MFLLFTVVELNTKNVLKQYIFSFCVFFFLGRERHTDRQAERDRERETDRQTERDRQRETERRKSQCCCETHC